MITFRRAFLVTWGVLLALALGCALTDYPIITDDRGDYSGIVRTAHRAYVSPTFQFGTIYPDGTDELFWMVAQNQYGDQMVYTHNNYDPTASLLWLDQTYCDWKFDDCEITRAWNPRQNDDEWDYEAFPDCSGFRSLTMLSAYRSRFGECGDVFFGDKSQALARVFADLDTTTWRGGRAYVAAFHAGNLSVRLTDLAGQSGKMPLYGQHEAFITEDLNIAVPMKPNMRHQFAWLRSWVAEHGRRATIAFDYDGLSGSWEVSFVPDGLDSSAGRL